MNFINQMEEARLKAVETFKYFYREIIWESRRVVKGLDMAAVKVQLCDESNEEQMWIGDIYFDGFTIEGYLLNQPHKLSNYNEGDLITVELENIIDWLFSMNGKSYGGFVIQLMRSLMSDEQRVNHDNSWGIDFGDFNNIEVVAGGNEALEEHPMSINMKDSFENLLKSNPNYIKDVNEFGYTALHCEVINGNKTMVELLLKYNIDKTIKSNKGYTALDLAIKFDWKHIIPLL